MLLFSEKSLLKDGCAEVFAYSLQQINRQINW